MASLLKCNALFLHIPKTGGSWIRHVLRQQDLVRFEWPHPHPDLDRVLNLPRYYPLHFAKQSTKHCSLTLYCEIQEAYKFCFVRHPHSWYESYWRFMTGLDWKSYHEKRISEHSHILKEPWHPNSYLERIGSSDFNSFMESVIDHYPGYLTQMYGWYAPPGEVDFIGRTNSLVDDLISVLRRVGADFDEREIRNTEKINTSPSHLDKPDWDEDLRAKVRQMEAPIFERFGYG